MPDNELKIVITAETQIEAARQALTSLTQLQRQALPAQQGIAEAWQQQVRAQQQATQLARQQANFFRAFGSGLINATGIGAIRERISSVGLGAAAGGFIGAAAGEMLISTVHGMVNAFEEAIQAGLRLADAMGDLAELIGTNRAEALALRFGASAAGVPQRGVMRALFSLANVRGRALGGDAEAVQLLTTFGLSEADIQGDVSNLTLARRIVQSLGRAGPRPEDDPALRKIFGESYRQLFAAILKAPGALGELDDIIKQADRVGSIIEFRNLMNEIRKMKSVSLLTETMQKNAESKMPNFGFRLGIVMDLFKSFWEGVMEPKLKTLSDLNEAIKRQAAGEGLELPPERTAGTYTPPQPQKKRRELAFDFNAPESALASRGLFLNAQDWRLWNTQINTSKSMLEELREIRATLNRGLKVEWEE
jgi:hypothetical protein